MPLNRRLSVRTLPAGKRLPLVRMLSDGTLRTGKRPERRRVCEKSRQVPLDRRMSVRTLRAGKRLPLDRRLSVGTLRVGKRPMSRQVPLDRKSENYTRPNGENKKPYPFKRSFRVDLGAAHQRLDLPGALKQFSSARVRRAGRQCCYA